MGGAAGRRGSREQGNCQRSLSRFRERAGTGNDFPKSYKFGLSWKVARMAIGVIIVIVTVFAVVVVAVVIVAVVVVVVVAVVTVVIVFVVVVVVVVAVIIIAIAVFLVGCRFDCRRRR